MRGFNRSATILPAKLVVQGAEIFVPIDSGHLAEKAQRVRRSQNLSRGRLTAIPYIRFCSLEPSKARNRRLWAVQTLKTLDGAQKMRIRLASILKAVRDRDRQIEMIAERIFMRFPKRGGVVTNAIIDGLRQDDAY